MIVTYSPKGEPVQKFEFLPDRVKSKRAEDIERNAGTASTPMPFESWVLAVQQGSARARRVLMWHLLSLTHPRLRMADVDFAMGEVEVEMTLAELLELRDRVAKSRRAKPEEREEVLELLDAEIEAEREKAAEAEREKAAGAEHACEPEPAGEVLPYDGADLAVDGLGKAR